LAEVVRMRARAAGDGIAYTFLSDGSGDARSMTWAQLDQRASVMAASLQALGAHGEPVLLALPSGLSFIESLFACWYAGAIAVPVSLPRHRRVKHRLHHVVADAGAKLAIGTQQTRQRLEGDAPEESGLRDLTWLDADTAGQPEAFSPGFVPSATDVALLQYTSGATGTPRGVIVTHANLMRNSAIIAEACGHGPGETIAGWLPLFHDMGLVGVLQAAFSGARCVFMSPERFLMRPELWLQMISDYKACSSPAPNFAYDLCVEKMDDKQKRLLDLSCWRNALNGSEPVRAATLDRFAAAFAESGFRKSAFFPCYGLAESTLFVSGPTHLRALPRRSADGELLSAEESGGHVGCGQAFGDTQIAIVDRQTSQRVFPGTIGEIWVAGGSVAAGYWKNPAATAATFNAQLLETGHDDKPVWLRTGDLGFIAGGELFITGRLRELIIIAGRNLFPVDLEHAAALADPALSAFAAFSVDDGGAERLIIAAEVRRDVVRPPPGQPPRSLDCDAICRRVRAAVASEYDATVHQVLLLSPAALPRTTSGKISRVGARDAYIENTLNRFVSISHEHAVI
jgi:acyl-CoA synthetase (AMP-forming)/AMP-acid ligase II